MLGPTGATVYCTVRSVGATRDLWMPQTIEEPAGLITAEGGLGFTVRTDHTATSEVEQPFARIRHGQGRLDVLVNGIRGGDALME